MIPDEQLGAYNRNTAAKDSEYFKGRAHRQSPIDLISRDAVYCQQLQEAELSVVYGAAAAHGASLVNTGDALQLRLNTAIEAHGLTGCEKCCTSAVIKGGPLQKDYVFQLEYLSFHWGKDGDRGSEHKINSYSYPMEIQFVHWNKSLYASYEDALEQRDGIAIISIFVKAGQSHSTSVGAIVEQLEAVRYKGQRVQLPVVAPLSLDSLLPNPALRDYWTYDGSLTSWPFSENVTWIIFRYPLVLTFTQIEEFRRIKSHPRSKPPEAADDDGFLADNFRSPQPINSRVIKASFL